MKEPKCEVCKFTSFIMFVSRIISLLTFQKSSMLYMFTPQNPVNFTPMARIHHPHGCWEVSTMSQAGAPSEWALSAPSMAPTKLPLYGNSHKVTHAHTHTHIYTHIWRIKQSKGALHFEKYWTNLRHYLT